MSLDTAIEQYIIGTNLLRGVMDVDSWHREKQDAYETISDETATAKERHKASRRWEEMNALIQKYTRLDEERRELSSAAKTCDREDAPIVEQLIHEAYEDLLEAFETVVFTEEDDHPAILSVQPQEAGRGEQNVKDIQTLEDMYFGWFDRRGWDFELLSEDYDSLEVGIEGSYALGWTRSMEGITKIIHQDGKTYTNRYSTGVIKQANQEEVVLDDAVIDEEFYKASTSGGQHANTAATNVRLTHKPTSITAQVTGRHRSLNRRNARKLLRSKIKEHHDTEDQRLGTTKSRLLSIDLRYPTVGDDSTNRTYSGKRAKHVLQGSLSEVAMSRIVDDYD